MFSVCYLEIRKTSCSLDIALDSGGGEKIDLDLHLAAEPSHQIPPECKKHQADNHPLLSPLGREDFEEHEEATSKLNKHPDYPHHFNCAVVTHQHPSYSARREISFPHPRNFIVSPPTRVPSARFRIATHQHQPLGVELAGQSHHQTHRSGFDQYNPHAMQPETVPSSLYYQPGRDKTLDELPIPIYESHLVRQEEETSSTGNTMTNSPIKHQTGALWKQPHQTYSSKILDWNPHEIDGAAAFSALSMTLWFMQEALWDFGREDMADLTREILRPSAATKKLTSYHLILIPFIYKLTLKPLTEGHWELVIQAWNRFWREFRRTERDPDFLKKLCWFSDLILEATMPELYHAAAKPGTLKRARNPPSWYLRAPESRIIRYLSEGKKVSSGQLTHFHASMDALTRRLHNEFSMENSLADSGDAQVYVAVENRLRDLAESILSPVSKTLSNLRMDEANKLPSFILACQRALLSPQEKAETRPVPPVFSPELAGIVEQIRQKRFQQASGPETSVFMANGPAEEEEFHYPTGPGADAAEQSLLQNPFLDDPGYIRRYRDPSRHDSYEIRDHHQPMEQSWLSSDSPLPAPESLPPARLAICFPGSSSQYLGMGSFIAARPEFARVWTEAAAHLAAFPAWMASLNLVDHFLHLGYSPQHALLLGAPPAEPCDRPRSLRDIVLQGPQNELSRCANAQPAILITSMAYLRTLEVDGKMPVRGMATVYAGHSSGEYTACVASKALDFKSGIHLTRLYGLLSERSMALAGLSPSTSPTEGGIGGPREAQGPERRETHKAQMSALLINEKYQASLGQKTYDYRELIALLDRFNTAQQAKHPEPASRVHIASFNSSNQIVLSGARPAVLAACAFLNELEIANRAADLPCSSPFHSEFMRPAADGMARALAAVPFAVPDRPILVTRNCPPSDPTASSSEPSPRRRRRKTGASDEAIETVYIDASRDLETLKAHLSGSICRPVWWAETVNELLLHHSSNEHGVQLLFVGPGKALHNLCKKQIAFNSTHPSPAPMTPEPKHPQIVTRSLATIDDFHALLSA
ncbi:hypothetical protein PtB15_4B602 [Puccinia triticina]|nr:hypothetical protein PtB15_4B602 [Puccinia triticina]